ncbi:MAG TPA: Maf family protein [Anaerolineales bacterium]
MLVLASASPRRRKLLDLAGWEFQVLPVEIDESALPAEQPYAYVTRLALQKARAAASQAAPGGFVVAADTAVVADEQILGKPADREDAIDILRRLRDQSHQVYTALAIMRVDDQTLLQDVCITNVLMRNYSDTELLSYVDSGDPMDKAGAYAIQHRQFDPVARLHGCYTNVVGLPMCYLNRLLHDLAAPLPANVSLLCNAIPPEPCQVSPALIADL